jgi:hypothetical protein
MLDIEEWKKFSSKQSNENVNATKPSHRFPRGYGKKRQGNDSR